MSECKHCGMEREHCHYCCDGSHVDLLEKENAELRASLVKVFERVREIRDKPPYISGLIGIENYIHEILEGGEG